MATPSAVRLACGLGLAVLLGLWTGGYPGAALLPAAILGFCWAIAHRRRSRLASAAADPWLLAVLMVVAAFSAAAGDQLWTHGVYGIPLTALSGVIPELFCLVVAARLVAAVLASAGVGDGADIGQARPGSAPDT